MTVFLRIPILIIMLIQSNITELYGQLIVTGEIRPRTEFRNGFKTLLAKDEPAAFFTEQRSRLNITYQEEKLTFHLSAQEVRIWGATDQIYKDDPSLFNMYEAWGQYKISGRVTMKAGRQALNYDNARFLGNLDWAQQGRSHDALLLMYEDTLGTKIHLGAGFNQNIAFEPGKLSATYYDPDNYKTMQFVWFLKNFLRSEFSLLILNDGRQHIKPSQKEGINFRQTIGLTGEKHFRKLHLNGELYHQRGKDPSGIKTSAWLASASLTYRTKVTPLTIGLDYLSGTEPGATINRSFNPLYGTNHKFYGFMDYFYVGNNHGQEGTTAGLKDYFIKTNFRFSKKTTLSAHLHLFESAVAVYDTERLTDSNTRILGEEIDLVLNARLNSNVTFNLGYSQLFGTESLNALKGKDNAPFYQSWAWAMVAFKPTLFTSHK